MKKLSVIIPVYNVAEYLAECLTSVCNQTLTDIEIICVNDGSTDNSGDILQDFAKQDTRIQIINQENAGLSAARNTGLKYATGEYITFLDSDDWVALDYYETLYKSAKENDADIAVGNVIYYYHDCWFEWGGATRNSFGDNMLLIEKREHKKRLLQSCAVWNKIYKRELIVDNNLHFYHGKMVEDFPFTFMAVALAGRIVCCPFTFVYYRQRQTSIMYDKSKQVRNTWDVLDNYYTLLEELKNTKLADKAFYLRVLGTFAIKNMSGWSARLPKKEKLKYEQAIIKYAQQFDNFDLQESDIYFARLVKTMKSGLCNKFFNIRYSIHKIEYSLLRVPLLRIKNRNETRFSVSLFGVLPILNVKFNKNRKEYYVLGQHIYSVYPKTYLKFSKNRSVLPFSSHRLISELRALEEFTYIPNPGNIGDMLIACATMQLFGHNNIRYKIFKHDYPILENLVYGGGGIWTQSYKSDWIRFVEIFKKAKKVIILPSSFNDCPELIEVLDERFTVFCREEKSYNYLKSANTKAKIILEHDMAFHTVVSKIPRKYRNRKKIISVMDYVRDVTVPSNAFLMRQDCESYGNYETQLDVSALVGGRENTSKNWANFCSALMFHVVDQAETIVTDRLHVAIAGLLLGKEVYMLDNTYGKLSAVYNHSMKQFKNIHFCTELPDFAPKND